MATILLALFVGAARAQPLTTGTTGTTWAPPTPTVSEYTPYYSGFKAGGGPVIIIAIILAVLFTIAVVTICYRRRKFRRDAERAPTFTCASTESFMSEPPPSYKGRDIELPAYPEPAHGTGRPSPLPQAQPLPQAHLQHQPT